MKFWVLHEHDALCTVIYRGVGRIPVPWCERFAEKIVYADNGCWLWRNVIGRIDSERNRLNFCPNIDGDHKSIDACRWIYERVVGPIPEGLQLDHYICNNWRCVHPYHLEAVTNAVNNFRYASIRATWTQRDSLGRFAGRSEVV